MPAPATDVYSDRDAAPEIDVEVETEAESAEDTPEEKDDGDDKASESATALVGKTFFGDKKLEVGSKCEVRISRIFDDQIQLEYVKHKSDSDDDEDEPKAKEESVYD